MGKNLKCGTLPTLDFPKRRSYDLITSVNPPSELLKSVVQATIYSNFIEVCRRVKTLKTLKEWSLN